MPSLSVLPQPRPLRILHVIFSSRIAGSERYCADLAGRQAAAGHEVHVAGLQAGAIRSILSPSASFHGVHRFLRRLQLRRIVQRIQPDVCHGHLGAASKALGALAARPPAVATLHVGYGARQHGRLDGLICVNRAQRAQTPGFHGTVRCISNWLPEPETSNRTAGIRRELGLGPDVFLVGSVGRLHASKGMDVLVTAFRQVAGPGAALVLLGEGSQRGELERLRGDDRRIHLPGYRPAVHDFLRDLDLFVSPSRQETFGLAILEAMSLNLPILATATEGPSEYLRHQPVQLVPPGSVEALAAALRSAETRFRTNGRSRTLYDLTDFDPESRVAEVTDFYRQVIRSRHRSPAAVRPFAVVS